MADKPMYEVFTTPIGEAVFPWLTKPDTRFNKDGVYHVDISVPFELAQDCIARLEKVRDDFIATLPVAKQRALAPRPVYIEELTRPVREEGMSDEQWEEVKFNFVGEPTGNVIFRCKLKALVRPQDGEAWVQKPTVITADTGEAITDPVYHGSILRARGQIVPYTNDSNATAGITLRLRAVQVHELVTGGGDGAAFFADFSDADE